MLIAALVAVSICLCLSVTANFLIIYMGYLWLKSQGLFR